MYNSKAIVIVEVLGVSAAVSPLQCLLTFMCALLWSTGFTVQIVLSCGLLRAHERDVWWYIGQHGRAHITVASSRHQSDGRGDQFLRMCPQRKAPRRCSAISRLCIEHEDCIKSKALVLKLVRYAWRRIGKSVGFRKHRRHPCTFVRQFYVATESLVPSHARP